MKKNIMVSGISMLFSLGILGTDLAAQSQPGYFGNYFQHIATSESFLGGGTNSLINNSLTNGDGSKILLITHCYNPTYIHCNFPAGIYYNDSFGQWALTVENNANRFPEGSAYNIINPTQNGTAFFHETITENINGNLSTIDHSATNDNPGALVFITHSNALYNDAVTSVWYDNYRWKILNGQGPATPFPVNRYYSVFVTTPGPNAFIHTSTPQNIYLNWTIMDHPALNNNPNAIVIVTQRVDNLINNKPVGVYFNGTNWIIYNEDQSDMTAFGATFNVLIANGDPTGTGTQIEPTAVQMFPNPAMNQITLTFSGLNRDEVTIKIYSEMGSLVKLEKTRQNSCQVNTEGLSNGVYTLVITSPNRFEKKKLIIQR